MANFGGFASSYSKIHRRSKEQKNMLLSDLSVLFCINDAIEMCK